VKGWLTHADATRRVIKENYSHLTDSALLTATIEENVLVQLENLRTHPAVRARMMRGELSLYGWVYKIETGEVFQFDPSTSQYFRIGDGATPVATPDDFVRLPSL
jgi:carbonic anhydrase